MLTGAIGSWFPSLMATVTQQVMRGMVVAGAGERGS